MAGIVPEVDAYPGSSYPAYVGVAPVPPWLTTAMTLQLAGTRRPQATYRAFVEEGVDDELNQFDHRAHHPPIVGDAVFEALMADHRLVDAAIPDRMRRRHVPSFEEMVETTAIAFGVASENRLTSRRGRGPANPARQVALYLSREVGGCSLGQIAAYFGLNHNARVSRRAQLVRERFESELGLAQLIESLHAQLVNGYARRIK